MLKPCRINHVIYQNKPSFSTCRKWCALLNEHQELWNAMPCCGSFVLLTWSSGMPCCVSFVSLTTNPLSADVSCGAAPEIPDARMADSPQERYLPGARVHYQCERNFEMTGANYILCSNGQWSEAPVCRGRSLCFHLAC